MIVIKVRGNDPMPHTIPLQFRLSIQRVSKYFQGSKIGSGYDLRSIYWYIIVYNGILSYLMVYNGI